MSKSSINRKSPGIDVHSGDAILFEVGLKGPLGYHRRCQCHLSVHPPSPLLLYPWSPDIGAVTLTSVGHHEYS